MQRAALEYFEDDAVDFWARSKGDMPVPQEIGDFGWWYPWDYVQLTCELAIMSNYALLPEPGGLNAQDWYWVQDLLQYLRIKARVRWEHKPIEDNPTPQQPAQSWATLR